MRNGTSVTARKARRDGIRKGTARRARHGRRRLAIESLEQRRVLATNSFIYGIDNANVIQEVNVGAKSATAVFNAQPVVGTGLSNAFAYDTSRNQFFFVDSSGNLELWDRDNPATSSTLTTLTNIGSVPANATFYNDAYWYFTEGTNTLNKVALQYTNGVPSFLTRTQFTVANCPTTANLFGDIAVNVNTGWLYAATTVGQFYRLNLASPTDSFVEIKAANSGNPSLQLAFSSDYATLYAQNFADGQWYTIDIATGGLSPIAGLKATFGGVNGLRDLGGSAGTSTFQSDLSITKSDGVTGVVAGDGTIYSYTLTVSNLGPGPASGVSVADAWPAAFTRGSFGTPSVGSVTPGTGGDFSWAIGSLASGATATLTVSYTVPQSAAAGAVTNTAVVSCANTDPNLANNTATDTNTVSLQGDLSITKTDGKTSVVPGTQNTYTIVVSNGGPSTVTGATVSDGLPATLTGVTWTASYSAGSSGASSGSGAMTDVLVTLLSGGTATFTVTGTVDAAATGTLTNTATVTAPAGFTDTNAVNNFATDTDTLTPQGDLSITKTDGVTSVAAGDGITYVYTLTVTNQGPSVATGVSVADTWPAAFKQGSFGTPSAGSVTPGVNGNFGWTVGTLGSGATATLTVSYTVPNATAAGTATNTAVVSSATTDPNPANNTATDTNTIRVVKSATDLKIEQSDGVTTVYAGDGVTYTYVVRVTNQGGSEAANVSVSDTWPAAFVRTAVGTPSQGSVTPGSNGNFSWTVGALASNGVATLSVSYRVPFGTAAGTATNTVVVTSTTPDSDPSNNTATDRNAIVSNVLVAGTDVVDVRYSRSDDGKNDKDVKDGGKSDKDDDKYRDGGPRVYVINPYTGKVEYSFLAYNDKGYSGGVRVAVGDLNNDGVLEVVVAPGARRVGDVKAFKLDGTPLPGFSSQPFGSKYNDGVEVSLGDVNGDGMADLVASKSTGLGDVQVSLSTGSGFVAHKSFVAFPTASKGYDGGATAAVGGMNRIVVGSGAGMTPTVKTFNIAGTPTLVSQYQPTFPKYTAGISVTAQNFTGGSSLDVIAAAGPNGKSQVSVYNGETNANVVASNTFAAQGKTSPAVFAAASALGSSPIVDTVFMSQGDGGKSSIKKVNAFTGLVDPTFAVTYNGKPLVGPLRIATNLRPPAA